MDTFRDQRSSDAGSRSGEEMGIKISHIKQNPF
jgi:hypothetical protein